MAVVNVRVGRVGKAYTVLYVLPRNAGEAVPSALTVPTAWARQVMGRQPRGGEEFSANFTRRGRRSADLQGEDR